MPKIYFPLITGMEEIILFLFYFILIWKLFYFIRKFFYSRVLSKFFYFIRKLFYFDISIGRKLFYFIRKFFYFIRKLFYFIKKLFYFYFILCDIPMRENSFISLGNSFILLGFFLFWFDFMHSGLLPWD
jgi:hypothetical protein